MIKLDFSVKFYLGYISNDDVMYLNMCSCALRRPTWNNSLLIYKSQPNFVLMVSYFNGWAQIKVKLNSPVKLESIRHTEDE